MFVERGDPCAGEGVDAKVDQPRLAEDPNEPSADVVFARVILIIPQSLPLSPSDRQLDLDRPGEQDLVERVVFQDGDEAARPRHPGQSRDRLGEPEQALGAPDRVEGPFGKREVPDRGGNKPAFSSGANAV